MKKVGNVGAVDFRGFRFGIGRTLAGHRVCVMEAGPTVMIFDLRGTLIIKHPWPKPGIHYVSNGRSRGPRPKTQDPRPKTQDPRPSECQRCPDTGH